MSKIQTIYDGTQHCTTLQTTYGKTVASSICSVTGGKDEIQACGH